MRRTPRKFRGALCRPALASAVLALAAFGCDPAGPGAEFDTAPIDPPAAGVEPSPDTDDLAEAFAAALSIRNRDRPHRLIDPFAADIRAREPLRRAVARLAVTGPNSTPSFYATPEARLAYWLNARAAWALMLALDADLPERMPPAALDRRRFRLDGEWTTLERIDAEVRTFGWRAVVAAPGVRLQRAGLPDTPFAAEDVQERIRTRLDAYIADDRRVIVRPIERELAFPPVLWQFRDEIIADYERRYGAAGATFITALLPHTTRRAHLRLQGMLGYTAVGLDRSGTLGLAQWPYWEEQPQ